MGVSCRQTRRLWWGYSPSEVPHCIWAGKEGPLIAEHAGLWESSCLFVMELRTSFCCLMATLLSRVHRPVSVPRCTDYMTKIAVKGKSSHETRMEEVMTPNPITVTPQHRCVISVGGWGLFLQLPGNKFAHLMCLLANTSLASLNV